MDIRKVAVLGAGAVGSYVIWGLSARTDIELGVVAEGRRGERLAQEGCAVKPSARYSTLQDLDAGRHTRSICSRAHSSGWAGSLASRRPTMSSLTT